jgi:hypothetical protein
VGRAAAGHRGSESKTAKPGECVIAKPKEPLYTANAHDARIPALAQECAPGPGLASLNDPRHHLSPADVAALGPMAAPFAPPQPARSPHTSATRRGLLADHPGPGRRARPGRRKSV